MLGAGWHAHTLNAPGKFLVSAPEHTTPKRARAYLVTDDDVARVTTYYGPRRPQLDEVSRTALDAGSAVAEPVPWYLKNAPRVPDEPEDTSEGDDTNSIEGLLWDALRSVPEDGADIAELMRMTGLGRSTIYRYLAQFADQGRVVQIGWGRWRAAHPGGGHDE
jgi:hypothetical protein